MATTEGSSSLVSGLSPWAAPAVAVMVSGGLVRTVITRRGQRPRLVQVWPEGENPYPGLDAYGTQFAPVFHGREPDVAKLVDRVRQAVSVPRRFVPVVGPSGCGKSSLVLAGLVPRLKSFKAWSLAGAIPPFEPNSDPIAELAGALATAVTGVDPDRLTTGLRRDAELAVAAIRTGKPLAKPEHLLAELGRLGGRSERVLMVIDQLEEAAFAGDEIRSEFMALLQAALQHSEKLVVVATLRSDSLGVFQEGPGSDLVTDPETVNVMGFAQLRDVIRKPASDTGTTIADDLVDRMVQDAYNAKADALPLLSYVLHDLYNEYVEDGAITEDEYEKVGGPQGAIANRADNTLEDLVAAMPQPADEARALVLNTWLNFVNLDGTEPTRRRVRYGDLTTAQQGVVDAYVDKRLLDFEGNGYDENTVLDVRHEAVLRVWPRLLEHIEENGGVLAERTRLERDARAWDEGGRGSDDLLTAERARRMLDGGLALPPLLVEFLEASVKRDGSTAQATADLVARAAIDKLRVDPEPAIRIAEGAARIAPTEAARSALYQTWSSGLRAVLRRVGGAASAAAWSPDGRLATAGEDGTVRIWHADGRLLDEMSGHSGPVRSIAWSADGRLASGGDDMTVQIWSGGGQWMHKLTGHSGPVRSVAWASTGRLASGSDDATARIWGTDGIPGPVLTGHSGPVRAVAWSTAAVLATGDHAGKVRLFTADGQEMRPLNGHSGPIRGLAWSLDGRIASASEDRTVRIWAGSAGPKPHVLTGHSSTVTAVGWALDGRLASASEDRTVRVWGADRNELYRMSGHEAPVTAVAWSNAGRLATASDDGTVRLWGDDKQARFTLSGHEESAVSVAWSSDGRLASGSTDGTVRIWHAAAGGTLEVIKVGGRVLVPVAWSFDGRLAFGIGNTTRISIREVDGTVQGIVPNGSNAVGCLAWSRDGRLALGANTGPVIVRTADGHTLPRGVGHKDRVRAVAWSPDGRLASASDDHTIRLWSPDGKMTLAVLEGHGGPVRSVAWSPDGRVASGSDDRTVRIWSGDGRLLAVLEGHGRVRSVDWSPDGRLASGSADNQVRIWDAHGNLLHVLAGHKAPVKSVAWSADGRLASASDDRTVRVWPNPVPVEVLLTEVGAAPLRHLTADERHRVLLP